MHFVQEILSSLLARHFKGTVPAFYNIECYTFNYAHICMALKKYFVPHRSILYHVIIKLVLQLRKNKHY